MKTVLQFKLVNNVKKNVFLIILFAMVMYRSSTLVLSTPKHFRNTDKYTDIFTHRYLFICVC